MALNNFSKWNWMFGKLFFWKKKMSGTFALFINLFLHYHNFRYRWIILLMSYREFLWLYLWYLWLPIDVLKQCRETFEFNLFENPFFLSIYHIHLWVIRYFIWTKLFRIDHFIWATIYCWATKTKLENYKTVVLICFL